MCACDEFSSHIASCASPLILQKQIMQTLPLQIHAAVKMMRFAAASAPAPAANQVLPLVEEQPHIDSIGVGQQNDRRTSDSVSDECNAQQLHGGGSVALLKLSTDSDIRAFLMCRHVLRSFGRRFQARIISNCSVRDAAELPTAGVCIGSACLFASLAPTRRCRFCALRLQPWRWHASTRPKLRMLSEWGRGGAGDAHGSHRLMVLQIHRH